MFAQVRKVVDAVVKPARLEGSGAGPWRAHLVASPVEQEVSVRHHAFEYTDGVDDRGDGDPGDCALHSGGLVVAVIVGGGLVFVAVDQIRCRPRLPSASCSGSGQQPVRKPRTTGGGHVFRPCSIPPWLRSSVRLPAAESVTALRGCARPKASACSDSDHVARERRGAVRRRWSRGPAEPARRG